MRYSLRFHWVCCLRMAAAMCVSVQVATVISGAQDIQREESVVVAPEGTEKLSSGLGGAYFVDAKLLKKYNSLKSRLQQLKKQIDAGDSTSKVALEQLEKVQAESKAIRDEIEATKTFVSAYKLFKKTEEAPFQLADSRRIIVIGDNVKVRGWEGPGIKCVIEKIILANEEPEDAEFDAIGMNHDMRVAEDIVGRTPERRAIDNIDFRMSEEGKKLTEEQLIAHEAFLRKLFGGFDVFADFQGKEVSVLSVEGLVHQEGNRQVSSKITSLGGGGTMGSEWKRHASVTIFVPPCKHVMVAGCQVKLDIEDVDGNLLLSTSQSRDRDYEGAFVVRNIKGNVTIDQAPVRVLDGVTGDVSFIATDEFVNSGTHHEGGFRTAYSFETHETGISNVKGDVHAKFLRTNLKLTGIGGLIDVENEYGNTTLELTGDKKIDGAMRVISESGEVKLTGPSELLTTIPIYAYTLCGTLQTDIRREVLDDVSFSTGNENRGWSGFVTPSEDRFSFDRFDRPANVLENAERKPGLDLISKAGRVSILTTNSKD